MKNKKRKNELSDMILKMGVALENEGHEKDDLAIMHLATFFTLISEIVLSDDDVYEFSNLCSMFGAKKILDDIKKNGTDPSKFFDNNPF